MDLGPEQKFGPKCNFLKLFEGVQNGIFLKVSREKWKYLNFRDSLEVIKSLGVK